MDYTIEYLVNDEFAEWEVYGTFVETSLDFEEMMERVDLGPLAEILQNIESRNI